MGLPYCFTASSSNHKSYKYKYSYLSVYKCISQQLELMQIYKLAKSDISQCPCRNSGSASVLLLSGCCFFSTPKETDSSYIHTTNTVTVSSRVTDDMYLAHLPAYIHSNCLVVLLHLQNLIMTELPSSQSTKCNL